jgi:hypothetical protein
MAGFFVFPFKAMGSGEPPGPWTLAAHRPAQLTEGRSTADTFEVADAAQTRVKSPVWESS